MIQSPEIEAKKNRKMMFHVGFKRGVNGSAYAPEQMADPDFKRGYEEGMDAVGEAVQKFCDDIGHDPSTDMLR